MLTYTTRGTYFTRLDWHAVGNQHLDQPAVIELGICFPAIKDSVEISSLRWWSWKETSRKKNWPRTNLERGKKYRDDRKFITSSSDW